VIRAGPVTDADTQLLDRATEWSGTESDFASLGERRLAEIADSEGLDFATALLYDRILRVPANRDFMEQADQQKKTDKARPDLVGVVPGAFYREHKGTGADGARAFAIARDLGCEAELVRVGSFGGLEENASLILDWLESHPGRRITLISLSKGGSDIKRALASPKAAAAFANVHQWVSFSGLVQGTPLVEWLRQRPLRWWGTRLILWWQGHRMSALEQLRHGEGTPLASWPVLPAHLRVVHVCGIPLRRHLAHPWASRGYERLAPLGPNDGGGILLGDLAALPGIVCPLWGVDHYLDPAWDVMPLLRGIVGAAISSADPCHASQSEMQPRIPPASRSTA